MFAMATRKGVKVKDITLSRPHFFLWTAFVETTWGFLTLCILVAGVVWFVSRHNKRRASETKRDIELSVSRQTDQQHQKETSNSDSPLIMTKIVWQRFHAAQWETRNWNISKYSYD
jgi:hypothetical protein